MGGTMIQYLHENNKTNFRYTQFTFDLYRFLKSLSFIKSDNDGCLYIVDPAKKEAERIERLLATTKTIQTGDAFLDRQGNVVSDPSVVQHQKHRFHYGK